MISRLSAPGKLLVSGEYVVLDGVEALVAAVDARVQAEIIPGTRADHPALPPEAAVARKAAERALGPADMDLRIDASALQCAGRKLGLGSSAAAAVVSAAAVLAWHGGDPAQDRRRVLHWALAGHRAVAPQGSGADVAASALGGLVRFQAGSVADAQVLTWPATVTAVVVWTGRPARTSDFVTAVRSLATDHPTRYRATTAPLREAAQALLAALVAADARQAVRLAVDHAEAMAALGEAAGVPIVTERLRQVFELARTYGGGAKPSGAGGGDVAVAFFAEPSRAGRFRAACGSAGLTPLPLVLGAEGVRAEGAPSTESKLKERG